MVNGFMNPKILEIEGWMHSTELQWLFDMGRYLPPDDGIFIEIGAWKGRSSAALYDGICGTNKIVISIATWKWDANCVDIPLKEPLLNQDVFSVYLNNMQALGFNSACYTSLGTNPQHYIPGVRGPTYLKMASVEASKLFLDGTVTMVFIDGDHGDCGNDIDAWLPKVRNGGIIAGHDYFDWPDTIQKEIHKRFYVNQIIYSIWVHKVKNE